MAGDLLLGTMELLASDAPLRLPDRFIPAFARGGVLTIWLDGCLALWPGPAWSSLSERVLRLPISAADARAFSRILFASAVEFEFGGGLVPVPPGHRRAAGLGERVVLVGAGDHAELWDPERWAAMAEQPLEDLALPTAV